MKLFVIGATGRTGQEIVQQGLERGHEVTAFVRSPEKMTGHSKELTVIKGSPMDEQQLAGYLRSHDAVLFVLGHTDFKPSSILRDSILSTVHAMKECGISRVVVESMAALFPGFFPAIVRFVLKNAANDSLRMEETLANSGLDWTIARPPRLTQANYRNYRSQEGSLPGGGASLSRKAVAAFMLDCVEQGKHVHKIVGIVK